MYKYGADTKTALETLAVQMFTELMDPAANESRTQVHIWEKQVNEYVKRCTMLTENVKTAYLLIYRQYSKARVETKSRHDRGHSRFYWTP
jgi:hypothetical protein